MRFKGVLGSFGLLVTVRMLGAAAVRLAARMMIAHPMITGVVPKLLARGPTRTSPRGMAMKDPAAS